MSPGRRAWIEKMVPLWSERVAVLRQVAVAADASAAVRAGAIERIVAGMRAELAAAPVADVAADAGAAALAEAMETLRSCQPYFHPEWQIMVGNTHFLDRPRESAARKIEALGGTIPDGWIIYWVEPDAVSGEHSQRARPKAEPLPPPPEPLPFTAGPQLDMFG